MSQDLHARDLQALEVILQRKFCRKASSQHIGEEARRRGCSTGTWYQATVQHGPCLLQLAWNSLVLTCGHHNPGETPGNSTPPGPALSQALEEDDPQPWSAMMDQQQGFSNPGKLLGHPLLLASEFNRSDNSDRGANECWHELMGSDWSDLKLIGRQLQSAPLMFVGHVTLG